jgi:hypothetical protein
MMERIKGTVSNRKRRLFGCACCRRIWGLLVDKRSRDAIAVAELFADGLASTEELKSAVNEAEDATERMRMEGSTPYFAALAAEELVFKEDYAFSRRWSPSQGSNEQTEMREQADLLREIFGNPFRPAAFDPAWRTSTAFTLAQGIYDERAFDRLPILADALQDAECDNDDILNHLRNATAPHVRGCWALDLVLGKE